MGSSWPFTFCKGERLAMLSLLGRKLVALVVGVTVGLKIWRILQKRKRRPAALGGKKSCEITEGSLDIRRRAQVAFGKPTDHANDLVITTNHDFSLDGTIFENLSSPLARFYKRKQLGVKLHWNDKLIDTVRLAEMNVPRTMPPDNSLIEFMRTDCDFSCEHADGSFMDHLRFCHDYSAVNFSASSPRVLLLHSILGVGTNLFPMSKDKMPKLAKLVDPQELNHICAFPSVLRQLLTFKLLSTIDQHESTHPAAELDSVSVRQVIDNEWVQLNGDQFWEHLNFQLIHGLDFLPPANWQQTGCDAQFQVFVELHDFLHRHNKLSANVSPVVIEQTGGTLEALLDWARPVSRIMRGMQTKAIQKYSKEIGHELSFKLSYAGGHSIEVA